MGFSVSGAFAILVLASFIAFGMLYTAGANSYERVTEATAETHDANLEQRQTSINISATSYAGGTLEVNVSNTGTTALSLNATDLVVDNDYQRHDELTRFQVVGNPDSSVWLPGETITMRVDLPTSPNRVVVVTEYGVTDVEVR